MKRSRGQEGDSAIEASETGRAAVARALRRGPLSAREIAKALALEERDVIEHLHHLERSLPNEGARLVVTPASCKKCQFVFEARERLTRPSRCPACKGERISPASFTIAR